MRAKPGDGTALTRHQLFAVCPVTRRLARHGGADPAAFLNGKNHAESTSLQPTRRRAGDRSHRSSGPVITQRGTPGWCVSFMPSPGAVR